MKQIIIQTKPHETILNKQVGDYQETSEGLLITVADLGSPDLELLVAIHEIVEYHLIKKHGISIKEIENFDAAFEQGRKDGDESEAGDDILSPYRKEHFAATNIERLLADYFQIDWIKYENIINMLDYGAGS